MQKIQVNRTSVYIAGTQGDDGGGLSAPAHSFETPPANGATRRSRTRRTGREPRYKVRKVTSSGLHRPTVEANKERVDDWRKKSHLRPLRFPATQTKAPTQFEPARSKKKKKLRHHHLYRHHYQRQHHQDQHHQHYCRVLHKETMPRKKGIQCKPFKHRMLPDCTFHTESNTHENIQKARGRE